MIGTKAAAKRAQLGGFSHRRISSQGRYSTKRGQCRASHISRAQASKLKNRRPPVADTHVWSPNSWPFPSDIQSCSGYGGLLDHGNATTDRRCIAALGGEKGASGAIRRCPPNSPMPTSRGAARALGATVGSTRLAKRRHLREALTVISCAHQRLGLLSGHHPIIVLGVLVEILCFDRIATQECGLCERQITLVLSFGAGHVVVTVSASLSGRSGRTET
jgi:hypothetical protein